MKKEWNIVNLFNMQGLFLAVGFSKILSSAKENFLISIFIGYILGVILLYFLNIKKKNNFINIILYSILAIYTLVILINMSSTIYLNLMSKSMICIPLFLLILYIINKKEIVFFRVSSIMVFINIVIYALVIFCLLPYVDISNFVYTNTTYNDILFSSINFTILSTSLVLTTKDNDVKDKSLIKTYTIACLFLILDFIVMYGIFSYPLVSKIRYPEYVILKKISIAGAIQNIENFVSFIWLFNIIISLLSILNCLKKCLKEKKQINIFIPIFFIIAIMINKYYVAMLIVYKYEPFILGLTTLLFILFNYKKKTTLKR